MREQVEAQVIAAVQEQVSAGVASAVREQVSEQVISTAAGMSKSDYEAAVSAGLIPEETQNAVSAAIDAQMQTDNVKALIEANITAKMASDEIKATIKANTDAQKTAEILSQYISMDEEEIYERLISKDKYQVEFGSAGRGVNYNLMSQIQEHNLPGITFVRDLKRYYPNGIFASHLIGFALKEDQKDGSVLTKGKMGLLNLYLHTDF